MSEPEYLAPGAVLAGRYEVVREIGRGGYSVVYEGRDRTLGAPVALKLLVPPPAGAAIARERMRREVQAVRGLAHANIVGVHDFVEDGPSSFVVMEYVPGPDLAVRVRQRGPLAPDDGARLGRDVALALGEAHRHGILHRDVKPQNILLAADGRARLTDFGAARLSGLATVTQTGGLVGTLAYLAPELIDGGRGDARSDVYSLGLTLYFALTGHLPERTSQHLPPVTRGDGHHPRSVHGDVPEWLDGVVARATRADAGRRYHSADELAAALERQRDDDRDAALGPASLDFCLMCGSPDGAALATCPDCRGVPAGPIDRLVFVMLPTEPQRRRAVSAQLARLVARAPAGDVAAAARGQRALLRVSSASAEPVLEQLRQRAVPVRTVALGHAWAAVPTPLYALFATVAVTGIAAGTVALPYFLASTPAMAGLLLLAAHRAVQTPLLAPRARRSALPPTVDREVSATLARLPAGPARRLLADLAKLAQHAPTADVVALLSTACRAAADLAALDDALHVLERRHDDAGAAPGPLGETIARLERARDSLMQQLLDALSATGRAGAAGAELAAESELAELTRALTERTERDAAARREVEALLAGGGA